MGANDHLEGRIQTTSLSLASNSESADGMPLVAVVGRPSLSYSPTRRRKLRQLTDSAAPEPLRRPPSRSADGLRQLSLRRTIRIRFLRRLGPNQRWKWNCPLVAFVVSCWPRRGGGDGGTATSRQGRRSRSASSTYIFCATGRDDRKAGGRVGKVETAMRQRKARPFISGDPAAPHPTTVRSAASARRQRGRHALGGLTA
jgi:hypothetical protein